MSDESEKEMDSDLKEYLAYFKGNTGTSSSKARMYTSQTNNKTVENLSLQKSLTSSKEDSLSKDSSFLNTTSHKKFNLKDVNDLQTSHTISEVDDVTLSPTNAGQDNDTASAVGKLVLSLKELGSVSEDTALSINSEDINTSSFNVKANVFTVDELIAASDAESIPTKDKNSVADDVMTDYKTTDVDDSEANSYKDDFEEEGDDEDTIVEESIASDESIKEVISSSVTEIQSSSISNSNALTNTNISSSPNVSEDSIVSETEETQTSQHSSTSKDAYTSKEHSPSKHEVAIQTDPSWKVLGQLGTVNNTLLQGHETIQCSEGETMALHNLVTQQLHLTRSLIETARSLHHSQTLAICPDYHYITLEDTKQFIETHKPRVLKMKKK